MKKILFILIIFITGCSQYHDLSNLTIVKSIGVNYNEQYELFAQIIDDINDEKKPSMEVIKVTGKTIKEAFVHLQKEINKEVFLSHIDLLVFDNQLKKDNYKEIATFFLNNNNFRNDFICIFSENLQNLLENSKYDEIEIFLKTNTKNKNITTKNFNEVMKDYLDTKTIILPNITFNNDVKYLGNFKYEGE